MLAFKRAGLYTVFGRLDVLAAATSGATTSSRRSTTSCPGCPGVSRSPSTARDPPRARQGIHIVLIKFWIPTPRSFTSPPSKRIMRTRLASTRGTSRSVKPPSRPATSPPIPGPGRRSKRAKACASWRSASSAGLPRAAARGGTLLVAQLAIDEIPPGYFNGWRDFLRRSPPPTPPPSLSSRVTSTPLSRSQWLDRASWRRTSQGYRAAARRAARDRRDPAGAFQRLVRPPLGARLRLKISIEN